MCHPRCLGMLLLAGALTASSVAATFKVSKDGRAPYSTVQSAVDVAKSGDEIVILDFAVYKEQVTIDSSKNRLTLRSENPELATRPTISFLDDVNVGPRNFAESQDQSKINFDMNGAVRIMRAQSVTIEGIILDGGAPAPFSWESVWEAKFPLFHGNAALTLYVAGDVIVRNCEVRNAYFGIYVKDRNDGGIYANANPADLQPQLVIPLSGFGKTGNHLFERNRFYGNSWGMYFESAWDLGSNVRYNLFYDNHHSKELSAKVKLMPEGGNQPGGAILFKDMMLSPVAIYNNTFYHNNLVFCANWRVGGQHLIFNNIIASPDSVVTSGHLAFDPALPNRAFNTLYAAQEQKPQTRSQDYTGGVQDPETNTYVQGKYTHTGYGWVSVMNTFPTLKPTPQTFNIEIPLSSGSVFQPVNVEWDILPGTPIVSATADKAFPQNANIKWFQISFKSTDPEDPDFLTPDWSDSIVKKLVIDQGWAEGGIRDADGSIADIGAIPFGGIPKTEIIVKPRDPVFVRNGTTASAKFEIYPLAGKISNPKIKYVRWIRNLPFFADAFGGSTIKIIPQKNIIAVDVPATPLVVGVNTLTFTIPAMDSLYGFFDIVVEGIGADGKQVSTNVGFLPYRKIEYVFDVVIKDEAGTKDLTSVQAGQSVQLWITPRRLDGKAFDAKINEVSVTLFSDNILLTPAGTTFALPNGFQGVSKNTVVFTKVPESGFDGVEVSGKFADASDIDLPIRGSSGSIKIIPGPPVMIRFQDPSSGGVGIVEPGSTDLVKVQAKDKYENNVIVPTSVSLISTLPDVGTVISSPAMSDSNGLAQFRVAITKGDYLDTFPIVATLVVNGATDNAKMVVGKQREKLWIFYNDVGAFDPKAGISGCSGTKAAVTIWISKDGVTPVAGSTTQIAVDAGGGLAVYATESSGDTVRLKQVTLENGSKKVYIKSSGRAVVNETMAVFAVDGSATSAARGNINFVQCNAAVRKAAYFSDNGKGSVDRVEIYFEKALQSTELPDSLRFFWPSGEGASRTVGRTAMAFDLKDSAHITVTLPQPFAEGVTRYSGSALELGRFYWWNPLTPDMATQTGTFAVADSVGPLISTAVLIERLLAGSDTLVINFSEPVDYSVVKGEGLTLLKRQPDGGFVDVKLTILKAIPEPDRGAVIVVVKDLGSNAPAEGDSLRITPNGPVADIAGNRAHPLNRPVVISVRKVAPDMVSAKYEDRNADGRIETVQVSFNKAVTPGEMAMQFRWENAVSIGKADSTRFTVVNPTTVEVHLAGLFAENALNNKTSGTLGVIVVFNNYEVNNKKDRMAMDGAAPVLDSVEYHYGRSRLSGADSTVRYPDTLYVKFTETVAALQSLTQPLLFTTASGVAYQVGVVYNGVAGSFTKFVVTDLPPDYRPVGKVIVRDALTNASVEKPGDSVWINTAAAVTDNTTPGNIQLNPANRRIAIVVVQPPFDLKVTIGSNPFSPRSTTGDAQSRISLKVLAEAGKPTDFVVSAVIYDKVGNVVKKIPEDDAVRYGASVKGKAIESVDSCVLWWDGTNRQRRFVGIGTYLIAIKTVYTTLYSPPVSDSRILPLGIKRE